MVRDDDACLDVVEAASMSGCSNGFADDGRASGEGARLMLWGGEDIGESA